MIAEGLEALKEDIIDYVKTHDHFNYLQESLKKEKDKVNLIEDEVLKNTVLQVINKQE